MKIIEPSYKIYDEDMPVLQAIELAGRTCYKSEDKITEDSAPRFVNGLVKSGHFAMIEHGILHFVVKVHPLCEFNDICLNEWMATIETAAPEARRIIRSVLSDTSVLVTANLRTLYDVILKLCREPYVEIMPEYIIMDALHQYLPSLFPEPIKMDLGKEKFPYSIGEKATCEFVTSKWIENNIDDVGILKQHLFHTVRFVCDRGVTHELVRHRVASFAQESTRYCTYSKDKFGNELTFIKPCFWDEHSSMYEVWKRQCQSAEDWYLAMIENGAMAQEARSILPHSIKAEIVITANEDEWQHILNLRAKGTTGKPHPQMAELMIPLLADMNKRTNGRLN